MGAFHRASPHTRPRALRPRPVPPPRGQTYPVRPPSADSVPRRPPVQSSTDPPAPTGVRDAVRQGRGEATLVLAIAGGVTAVLSALALVDLPVVPRLATACVVLAVGAALTRHPRAADRGLAALVAVLLLPALVMIGLVVKLTGP